MYRPVPKRLMSVKSLNGDAKEDEMLSVIRVRKSAAAIPCLLTPVLCIKDDEELALNEKLSREGRIKCRVKLTF